MMAETNRNAMLGILRTVCQATDEFAPESVSMPPVRDNLRRIYIQPANRKHGAVVANYFGREREVALLAKSDAGYRFAEEVQRRLIIDMPALH